MTAMATSPDITPLTCPGCGCGHLLGSPLDDWRTCRFCGRRVRSRRVSIPAGAKLADDQPRKRSGAAGVDYHVLRCPYCGSDNVVTTSSPRPVRYHKCRGCDSSFKSVEKPAG